MITYSEENAVKLSPTKKDFYQMWMEVLDNARAISNRWDPSSTNESDPGIILLKELVAVADKINFNVDSSILEAFMPSAAQLESMRKLTEMMGYNMKYYRSATTDVTISYKKAASDPIENFVIIDRFTSVKDVDDTINYITLNRIQLNKNMTSQVVPCIEGQLIVCSSNDNNIISMRQINDLNRYYLPESQIAENGIFVSNISNDVEGHEWKKVDNLNVQQLGNRVFKIGYDSKERLPYIQFPDDISSIIEDGLIIRYVRTSGVNGNISQGVLCKMEKPANWSSTSSDAAYFDEGNYSVNNASSARNGSGLETINSAYNNYKKTVGTFDTLVTCRDYMNKIYQLTVSDTDTTNLVSNVIVSDIRDDINNSLTVCTFGDRGVEYEVVSEQAISLTDDDYNKPSEKYSLGTYKHNDKYYICVKDSATDDSTADKWKWEEVKWSAIEHNDLILYPFKNVLGLNNQLEYKNSFKYDDSNLGEIKQELEDCKTMSHAFVNPKKTDLACIKNYYNLSAKITTNKKVNSLEQADILNNVYTAIYKNFNMRNIDFGEEIPYDDILKVIEEADSRINFVSLSDPELTTKFCSVDRNEYGLDETAGKLYFNKIALKNILAGRVPLFKYDESFKPEYNEQQYPSWTEGTESKSYDTQYKHLHRLVSHYDVPIAELPVRLNENEVIQFRLPNLRTTKTYPAYVNYYLHIENSNSISAVAATMITLRQFLNGLEEDPERYPDRWSDVINNYFKTKYPDEIKELKNPSEESYDLKKEKYGMLFTKNDDADRYDKSINYVANTTYYYIDFGYTSWVYWFDWVKTIIYNEDKKYNGIYYAIETSADLIPGKLCDGVHRFYLAKEYSRVAGSGLLEKAYIQRTWESDVLPGKENTGGNYHTADGLGQDVTLQDLVKDEEYKLKEGDYLCVNYTQSDKSATGESTETKTVVNYVYKHDRKDEQGNVIGTIIRPNFALGDSKKARSLKNFNKTSGFDFTDYNISKESVPGMFTLGTNEQIEIREIVKVELDDVSTNIYWIRNDEDRLCENGKTIEFEFDSEPVYKTEAGHTSEVDYYKSYTLKDNEYLFYTDRNKTSLAYYGSGTKITRGNNVRIWKSKNDNNISLMSIVTEGLGAGIPWKTYNFKTNPLVITEYQYINLLKDNELKGISLKEAGVDTITNEFVKCDDAYYSIDSGSKVLPKIQLGDNYSWEVRSKLEYNFGPTVTQELNEYDSIDVYDSESATPTAVLKNHTIDGSVHKVAIKCSAAIQTSLSDIDMTTYAYDDDGNIKSIDHDKALKIFENTDVEEMSDSNNNSIIPLNNFGDGLFTKIDFSKYGNFELNALIPGNGASSSYIGLIMFYCRKGDSAFACSVSTEREADEFLRNFNNNESYRNRVELSEGLNIIEIKQSCKIKIDHSNDSTGTLTFSGIDIIDEEHAINEKLCYKAIDKTSPYKQVLSDISNIMKNRDIKFYYNAPMNNENSLEFNQFDSKDTLENPFNLYDYNNLCNKFVISEINADTLKDNIVISRNSRL